MVRRAAVAALVCLSLCGCTNSRFVEHPITSWFTPAPVAPVEAAADTHCRDIAREHKREAYFQGEDEATQREVYDRSYAACQAWDAAHVMQK
jgi:hypothetical protein